MKLKDSTMLDLSRSCIRCEQLQLNENSEMNCGLTNHAVHFEDTCDLFEMNKEMQERKDKEESEYRNKVKFSYAPVNKRIGNYAIDVLAIVVIEMVTGVFLIVFYGMDSPIYSLLFNDSIGKLIFIFLLNVLYYTLFEAITGKTIGKYLTKTKVVTLTGGKPGWAGILLRSVCRFIPLDQISFILNSDSGWHDSLSKTMVVDK